MRQMLTPQEAQRAVLDSVSPLGTERVPLKEALGRTLAHAIRSPFSLPPFANSAMDGYAVRAEDIAHASPANPITLPVLTQLAAGDAPSAAVAAGTAARIMTGAPLPPGADCVVMREDTRESATSVDVLASAAPGQSIRRAGSDIAEGEIALQQGAGRN